MSSDPLFHVCVSCKRANDSRAGQRLFDAMTAAGLVIEAVVCHAACQRAVTASISTPGKWRYILGGLDSEQVADLALYAQSYAASKTGAVLRSRRPASLAEAIIARVPSFPSGDQP